RATSSRATARARRASTRCAASPARSAAAKRSPSSARAARASRRSCTCLALLDSPTSGTVLVDGQDSRALTTTQTNQLRNEAYGFVFQQFFMIPSATVLENVMLPLKIKGVPPRERRERA